MSPIEEQVNQIFNHRDYKDLQVGILQIYLRN